MDSIDKNKIIFTNSFQEYGDDARACLFGTNQDFRYRELNRIADLKGASVLEIGCGIGGFYEFCVNNIEGGGKGFAYKGIDIVPEMIDLDKKKYPEAEWDVCNILEDEVKELYDYVILCGVFNVATETHEMKELLEKSFLYCKKGMAFNFISTYVNFKDKTMSYHNPQEIFSFCMENMSRKVNMNHHYAKCDVSVFVERE